MSFAVELHKFVSGPLVKDFFILAFNKCICVKDTNTLLVVLEWYETFERVLYFNCYPQAGAIILQHSLLVAGWDETLYQLKNTRFVIKSNIKNTLRILLFSII